MKLKMKVKRNKNKDFSITFENKNILNLIIV